MSFAAYTAPHPQTRFSPQFFASITIADAADLIRDNQLPRILPKNSVSKWAWDRTEPTAISEIIVAAGEDIPCPDNMYPITGAAETAYYKEGAHSVCLQIGNRIVRYHLSKLRLILGVNKQMYNLAAAAGLLDGIVSGKLLLPNLIEEFKLNRFSEPLAEFHVTQTPIYMLGCLLSERWAEEDVLNTCAEMIYYRQAALFLDKEPSFLFLPTSFFNNCRILVALPHAPDNLLLCYVVQNGGYAQDIATGLYHRMERQIMRAGTKSMTWRQ